MDAVHKVLWQVQNGNLLQFVSTNQSGPRMSRKEDRNADDEATGWFVLLRDEDATEEDWRRFGVWRSASAGNDQAWREIERLWGALDHLADQHPADALSSKPDVLSFHDHSTISERSTTHRRLGWRSAAAAAVLLFVIGVGWQITPVGLLADYRAGIGERRIVRLEDGSELELGTGSAVDVNYTQQRREVRLLAGEVFFTVEKDPRRPFVVTAEQGQVAVLGTAFNVRIDDSVFVAVVKHTVEVSAGVDAGVRVTEGEKVHFNANGVSTVTSANLDNIQAWRNDRLVFIDTPLNKVITELQRYRHGHIQLLGGKLGRLRVTAVFDSRRPDDALDTIAHSLGLRVYRATNLLIGLTRN